MPQKPKNHENKNVTKNNNLLHRYSSTNNVYTILVNTCSTVSMLVDIKIVFKKRSATSLSCDLKSV